MSTQRRIKKWYVLIVQTYTQNIPANVENVEVKQNLRLISIAQLVLTSLINVKFAVTKLEIITKREVNNANKTKT